MKYYVFKNLDGLIYTQGLKGQKPVNAIGECPVDEHGCPVTDPRLISIEPNGNLVYNKSAAEQIKKNFQEQQQELEDIQRMQNKACCALKELDVSKVKSMADMQEALFNILRVMGLK